MASKIGFIDNSYRALPDLPEMQKYKLFRERKRIEEFFDSINDSMQRMHYILDALESFRDTNAQDRADVDIHKGIDDALIILKNKMGFEIEVVKEYCADGLIQTFKSINNVTLNLLSNAIDAIGEAGKITVRTERTAKEFVFSVTDTGCGMDEATLKRIFEPFFTTKEPGKGTGLGLHLVHQIVYDQLQGKIEFQSAPGKGTTAKVTIPL